MTMMGKVDMMDGIYCNEVPEILSDSITAQNGVQTRLHSIPHYRNKNLNMSQIQSERGQIK